MVVTCFDHPGGRVGPNRSEVARSWIDFGEPRAQSERVGPLVVSCYINQVLAGSPGLSLTREIGASLVEMKPPLTIDAR